MSERVNKTEHIMDNKNNQGEMNEPYYKKYHD